MSTISQLYIIVIIIVIIKIQKELSPPVPNEHHNRFGVIFHITVLLSIAVMLLGIIVDGPVRVWSGLYNIMTRPDLLITDYVATSGTGAAMLNCGLLMLISVTLLHISGDPFNGYSIVTVGLMGASAFSARTSPPSGPSLLAAGSTPRSPAAPTATTSPSAC